MVCVGDGAPGAGPWEVAGTVDKARHGVLEMVREGTRRMPAHRRMEGQGKVGEAAMDRKWET